MFTTVLFSFPHLLFAAAAQDITQLQAEIQNRKAQVESINTQLAEYKKRIAEYASKAASLSTDVALLENEAAMTELDIAGTKTEIGAQELELQILQQGIQQADTDLATQRARLRDILFALQKQDKRGGPFEMVIGATDFGDVFQAAAQLADVNTDLQKALAATQQSRGDLSEKQIAREEKMNDLQGLQTELEKKLTTLETRQYAKQVLINETQDSENEYRQLLSELRQEQQAVSARISQLQGDITDRLSEADAIGDSSAISWPVDGIITAIFHDPTYPFRNLFEHSGLDIAVPQGTPITAAAPGVVAWAKLGRMYGNYVMIIHTDGRATLYAHMSRMDVVQDQYVSRGQIIGLSGGRAGSPGAGFSTGPHVHFEVRENGIPVDPRRYLP